MRIPAALLIAAAAAVAPPAHAAESYDGCTNYIDSVPATITTQGVWCLRVDLMSTQDSGVLIAVDTNNVTIDCNDFNIAGFAGPATSAIAVGATNRTNVAVRNCHISGFLKGVELVGDGMVVEDNHIDTIRWMGIQVASDAGVVRGNTIRGVGDASSFLSIAIGVSRATDVLDNVVEGVFGSFPAAIYNDEAAMGVIAGNRIRGVVASSGNSYGIFTVAGSRWLIVDNHVAYGPPGASGPFNSLGITCSNGAQNVTRDNTVVGWETGLFQCSGGSGNVVVP